MVKLHELLEQSTGQRAQIPKAPRRRMVARQEQRGRYEKLPPRPAVPRRQARQRDRS